MMRRPPSIEHLVGPKFCAKCFPDMDLNPHNSQLFEGVIIPILQMRKQSQRSEVTSTASEWWKWNSNRSPSC